MSLRRSARVQLKPETILPLTNAAPPAKKRVRKSKLEEQDDLITHSNPAKSMPPPPTTPNKRRKLTTNTTPAPKLTLPRTPSTHPILPNRTNAPLLTPSGKHTLPPPAFNTSPSKVPDVSTLTNKSLLPTAYAHLISVAPNLAPLIESHPCTPFSAEGLAEPVDPWQSLVSSIIGQQVSGAAASSIKRKFVALFNTAEDEVKKDGYWEDNTPANENIDTAAAASKPKSTFPTPAQVVSKDLPTLRTAGLSQRKAEYISGLAAAFLDKSLTPSLLLNGTDQEVHDALIAIRGLGPWSVEMFMLFSLKRTDVFSTGDLGVQRGMAGFVGKWKVGLKAKEGGGKWKYMKEQEMLEIGERFRPFRSIFMWYMWRIGDGVDISAIGEQV
ncbi:unnamed protein product [Zymoseptoria tritici ST99CH_1A5]|uniref:HhH-GPD domain-containing protein n=1 Tax=Zymoseptoria tritici ST99CH_1A5 TaxID=1276529 RepID=A0A1Y6LY84_ZYMTR|nr:unnamed protein product [Zymoseptoria tritici ST99CH_1A5]